MLGKPKEENVAMKQRLKTFGVDSEVALCTTSSCPPSLDSKTLADKLEGRADRQRAIDITDKHPRRDVTPNPSAPL